MKRLICVNDIEETAQSGQKMIAIDSNTIITPAARDAAKNLEVEFVSNIDFVKSHKPVENTFKINDISESEIDTSLIYNVIKAIADKGMLENILELFREQPFISESDSSGFKLIRGNTVKLEQCSVGKSVFYRELIGKKDSAMSAGILTIDNSFYDEDFDCEKIIMISEGSLSVTLNNRSFTSNQGDVLFIPKGSKATWYSEGFAKLFCMKMNAIL